MNIEMHNISMHSQELRAKGQLPASRGHDRFHDDSREIAREVNINDAPPPIRYNLTKRSVQDDIQRRTNTIVVIKGRYHATGMLADDQEGPLRLRIMPGNVGPVSLSPGVPCHMLQTGLALAVLGHANMSMHSCPYTCKDNHQWLGLYISTVGLSLLWLDTALWACVAALPSLG